jgi:hypothetical protein
VVRDALQQLLARQMSDLAAPERGPALISLVEELEHCSTENHQQYGQQ